MATCAENIVYLAAARDAMHNLLTGRHAVSISHADKSVSYYSRADLGALDRYIRRLQDLVDACNGVARTYNRAFRFIPD